MKQLKLIMTTIICAIMVVFISSCVENGKVNGNGKILLKLNLKKGDVFQYDANIDSKISQKMMGQDMDMSQVMFFGYLMEVTNVDDKGNADFKITYNHIKMKMSNKMIPAITYDSDDTASNSSNPALAGFSAIKGCSFTMTISPSGEMTNIKGVNEMFDKMFSAIGGSDPSFEATKDALKKQFGEDNIKHTFGSSFNIFPDHGINIGEIWEKDMKMGGTYPLLMKNKYQLKEIKDGKALLDVNSELLSDKNSKGMEVMGVKLSYDLKGDQKGTSELDTASGLVTKATLEQKIKGNVKMGSSPLMKEGMEWPMDIQSTTTITVSKLKK